jgi:hypothetical protein
MLCHFMMKQFQRKEHSHSEILLQSLLFLLHSATDLFCPPEDIIDIIFKSAEHLNKQLSCLYSCINAGDKKLDRIKMPGLRRRWTLLQKLVLASSGSDNTRELVSVRNVISGSPDRETDPIRALIGDVCRVWQWAPSRAAPQ